MYCAFCISSSLSLTILSKYSRCQTGLVLPETFANCLAENDFHEWNNTVKCKTVDRMHQNMHVIVHYHIGRECITLVFEMFN